ncbi:unnamed protein product [Dracunculus medinensis]|uniref:ZP domain-containing protein n=1 Tax=Dracunculus medinensis TaxID=318479 RepID=A0A0N4URG2_DRAME|nr:unnamed protein product [Dracunculus medinensis]
MFFGFLLLLPIVNGQDNGIEFVLDVGCKLNCGSNMTFITAEHYKFRPNLSTNLLANKICMQQCMHISLQAMKITETRATKLTTTISLPNTARILPSTLGRDYFGKSETIVDVHCKLTGAKCGPNMKLITVKQRYQFRLKFPKNLSFDKSKCAHLRFCTLNEKIKDYTCKLTGKKCGENMKFITVNRIEPIQFSIAFVLFKFCIQQCKCARKEYIEKDGKFGKLVDYRFVPLDEYDIPFQINRVAYSYGEEVFDFSCQLAGSKCGLNMMFVNIDPYKSRFAYPQFSSSVFCVVQCECIKPFEEKDGRCI